MTDAEFERLREQLRGRCNDILAVKGSDYAGEGEERDRFGNFKQISDTLAMFNVNTATPAGVWAVYFLKHVFSIFAYIGQRTESEPIDDRFADAINYLDLGYAMLKEGQEPTPIELAAGDLLTCWGCEHTFTEEEWETHECVQ